MVQQSDIWGGAKKLALSVLHNLEFEGRAGHYHRFERAAEAVWGNLMSNPHTGPAGQEMLENMRKNPIQVRLIYRLVLLRLLNPCHVMVLMRRVFAIVQV